MSKMRVVTGLRERMHLRLKAIERDFNIPMGDDMTNEQKQTLTSASNVPGLTFFVKGVKSCQEIDIWAEENSIGQVELAWYPVKTGGRGIGYAFELESDAVLFELRWR